MECTVYDNELMVLNRKEGIYIKLTEELLGIILRHLMNHTIADSWRKVYEREIFDGLFREVSRIESSKVDDSLVPLNNGIFNFKTNELIPYDGSLFFTRKLSVDYKPEDECPKFLNALEEIFCGDYELLKCIQEIFGYVLINNVKAEKYFILQEWDRMVKVSWQIHLLKWLERKM